MNNSAQVRTAQVAIAVVMWQEAVDADAAAEVIRRRAAANHFSIAELTDAIVTVAATSAAWRTQSQHRQRTL